LGSNHWRIEEFGRNGVGEQKDAQGVLYTSSEILPNAPDILMTTLPNDSLVSALQAKEFPVRLSTSAGDYLCNFALYHALWAIQGMHLPPRVGFLHVPADEQTFDANLVSAPVFSFEQHLEAVRILLEALPQSLR
jgi:pyroglutamyl-peptidase